MQLDSSGSFAVARPDVPEGAVAYEEAFVIEAYSASGLAGCRVHPGFRIQDVVLATKLAPPSNHTS